MDFNAAFGSDMFPSVTDKVQVEKMSAIKAEYTIGYVAEAQLCAKASYDFLREVIIRTLITRQ